MNTEFKGTQGEWKSVSNDSYWEVINNRKYNDNESIFTASLHINKYHKGKIYSDSLSNESKANAQLISAAPELLKALQDVYSDLFQGAIPNDLEFIKKAINKALGNNK
tara:strand:- start:21 stop:344 length:324 start_codon:yes stop_codon:yes gene_type:complete